MYQDSVGILKDFPFKQWLTEITDDLKSFLTTIYYYKSFYTFRFIRLFWDHNKNSATRQDTRENFLVPPKILLDFINLRNLKFIPT